MQIALSREDYAKAFHLLTAGTTYHEELAQYIEAHILPTLPTNPPSMLEVGAGTGKVAQRLSRHFATMTLIEPNPEQLGDFTLPGAEIVRDEFEHFDSPQRYDFILCAHVMYHVPLADWQGFIDKLMEYLRPGGVCLVVLAAARGQNYALHSDFTDTIITGSTLIAKVQEMGLPFEVVEKPSFITASTFDDMYALCRFIVIETSFTAQQLEAMSANEARAIEDKLAMHVRRCLRPDGTYRFEQDVDLVLLRAC